MSKKKGRQLNVTVNPTNYIKSGRARNLPIDVCFINAKWEEIGKANIFVVRKHANDNVTVASFFVDTFCIGVEDTHFSFSIPEDEFYSILDDINLGGAQMEQCDYTLAHNIVYGAVEFASEYGIESHKDFKLTQMILEEDNEDIELIDIEFGRNGKPFLFIDQDNPKRSYYFAQLNKYAGPDNYDFAYMNSMEDDYDEFEDDDIEIPNFESWTEDDWLGIINGSFDDHSSYAASLAEYIYIKTIVVEQEAEHHFIEKQAIQPISVTDKPLKNLKYENTKEQLNEIKKIDLFLGYNATNAELVELEEMILKDIEKWPQNPIFLSYLSSCYKALGNDSKAEEMILSLVTKFPDYLFSKFFWADLLLEKGEHEKIPEIFDGHYSLKSLCPERDIFQTNEVVTFNTLMCRYFLEKKDIYMATLYKDLVYELDLPPEIPLNKKLFLRVEVERMSMIFKMIEEAKTDDRKKKELLSALLN